MTRYALLIRGGMLVDPANQRLGRADIALSGGKVAAVDDELNPDHAREIFEADGKLVFPGLVDTHVHIAPAERAVGFRMLARAGVTCCL